MKRITQITLILSFTLMIVSCSKDEDTSSPPPTAEGYFKGVYGGYGASQSVIAILNKPGGGVRTYGLSYTSYDTTTLPASAKSDGYWELHGNAYVAVITGITGQIIVFRDTLVGPTTSMNGTILVRTGAVESPQGTFSVVKQ